MKKNFRKQNSNAKRTLRLETLESREMLDAVPLTAAEYADLRAQYAEFNLAENMDDMNVITLDLAEGDGLTELKAAITTETFINTTEQAEGVPAKLIECDSNADSTFLNVQTTSLVNGYNAHDVACLQAFFEQMDYSGRKNGTKINSNYNVNDPTTWTGVHWISGSQGKQVKEIYCYENTLVGSLDVSGCTALVELCCHTNQLTSLNVSNTPSLIYLYCYFNHLTSIDVSGCTAMKTLCCHNNKLTSIDISTNTSLEELYCYTNQLESLDVSQNANLTYLVCYSNNLTELDITQNTKLWSLECWTSTLSSVKLPQTLAKGLRTRMIVSEGTWTYKDSSDTVLAADYSQEDWYIFTTVPFSAENQSTGQCITFANNFILSTPTLNQPTASDTTVSVSWSEVESTSGYQLEYKCSTDTEWTIQTVTDTSTTFTGTTKQMYNIRVKALGDGYYSDSEYSSEETITLNHNPVAVDDSFTCYRQNFFILDVLANDSDLDGDTLSILNVTQPKNGNIILSKDDKILYLPKTGFSGDDSFTYTISDGQGGTSTATVTITAPENETPVAVDDSACVELNGHVLIDVLVNDSDPDGDALSILSVNQPGNGSVVLTKDDKILYLPKTGFSGDDSFIYTVSDGYGATAEATVNVKVIRTFKPLIVTDSGESPEKMSEWEVFSVDLRNGEGLAETQTVSLAWDASLFELNVAEAASANGVSVEFGEAVTENGITTQDVVLNVENPSALNENDLLASIEFLPVAVDSVKAGDSSDWTISVNREEFNVEVESFSYDIDDSGSVDIDDLVLFARVYFQKSTDSETAKIADFDGSGVVDIDDLVLFARNYYKSRPSKPATLSQVLVPSTTKLEELPTATRGNVNDVAMAAYLGEE